MNSLISFWLESGLALAVCYIYFYLVLRKKPALQFNRFYLLGGMAASLLVPFLHITWPRIASPGGAEVFVPGYWLVDIEEYPGFSPAGTAGPVAWKQAVLILYLSGSVLLFTRLAVQAAGLVRLVRQNPMLRTGNLKLVRLCGNHVPFSVFNYIFTGESEDGTEAMTGILRHECAHVRQWHSLDRIFAELLCVVLWFNPLVYLFRRSLTEVHEYLADRSAIRSGFPVKTYLNLLVGMAARPYSGGPASMFSNSITKKRLIMMNRKDHNAKHLTRKLVLLPLVTAVIFCFGFDFRQVINIPHAGDGLNTATRARVDNQDVPSGLPFREDAKSRVTSGYGMRKNPVTGEMEMHDGIDLAVPEGTAVVATADGTVEKADSASQGYLVLIAHDQGYTTLYTHLQKYEVSAGRKVRKGEVIGYSGNTGISTGPHLHYEIRKDGESVDPSGTFE